MGAITSYFYRDNSYFSVVCFGKPIAKQDVYTLHIDCDLGVKENIFLFCPGIVFIENNAMGNVTYAKKEEKKTITKVRLIPYGYVQIRDEKNFIIWGEKVIEHEEGVCDIITSLTCEYKEIIPNGEGQSIKLEEEWAQIAQSVLWGVVREEL